jgi:chemotaxis protein methyltransferase CheR
VPTLALTPHVFAILSGLVAERSGLYFEPAQAPIFAEKVGARAVEAGFESLLDYYYYLRYDPQSAAELDRLVEALVVGETYLFRELAPLETAVSDFVVPRVGEGRRPRIWCAASATGEEAHTVAMLLASRGLLDDVELVASDINASSLASAAEGRLPRRAVRGEIPPFARAWVAVAEREVRIDPRITSAIDWRRVNLIDDTAVSAMGTFDVVLCRNVLIYFNDETVRRVIDRLSLRLREGAALFVGISESLLRFRSGLHCEERNGVFLYRRPS